MKKYILMLIAIVFVAAVAFNGLSNGKTKTVKEGGILSVNDIQADPSAYKGTITINGVVAGKSHFRNVPQNVFLIIETSEAKICKQTGCARFYLPVQYEGKAPQEWDEVNVTGSFVENGKPFIATKVDVLRHLTFK